MLRICWSFGFIVCRTRIKQISSSIKLHFWLIYSRANHRTIKRSRFLNLTSKSSKIVSIWLLFASSRLSWVYLSLPLKISGAQVIILINSAKVFLALCLGSYNLPNTWNIGIQLIPILIYFNILNFCFFLKVQIFMVRLIIPPNLYILISVINWIIKISAKIPLILSI